MAKYTVEECRRISAWWLRKHGFFRTSQSGVVTWTNSYDSTKNSINIETDLNNNQIRFKYTQTSYWDEEKRDMNYTHGILKTPCNYGNMRYWFRCDLRVSGRYCGRRVGVLYKPHGSWYYGCRYCYDLTYSERNLNRKGIFSASFAILDLEIKAERLRDQIKRKTWKGRPTRKQRRLNRLYARMDGNLPQLEEEIALFKSKKGV